MNAVLEQIAPDIAQAIISQATARGMSVNDYLRQLLGLTNGHDAELAIAEAHEKTPPRNEDMLSVIRKVSERLKDMPVRGSTEETLKMIREARGGAMWGYEPTESE